MCFSHPRCSSIGLGFYRCRGAVPGGARRRRIPAGPGAGKPEIMLDKPPLAGVEDDQDLSRMSPALSYSSVRQG